MMPRSKALLGFQLLQANLDVQSGNELLNTIYNMVQKKNLHAVKKRLFRLKESLHDENLKCNMVQEAASGWSDIVIPKQVHLDKTQR